MVTLLAERVRTAKMIIMHVTWMKDGGDDVGCVWFYLGLRVKELLCGSLYMNMKDSFRRSQTQHKISIFCLRHLSWSSALSYAKCEHNAS